MSSHPALHFYQVSSKYSDSNCVKERTQNQIQTQEAEVTPIVRKPVLYMTHPLILF